MSDVNDVPTYRPPAVVNAPKPPADVPTGAERYLAERLADPEYRAAYEAAAPVTGDDLRERIARAIYEEEHDWPWKNANHPDWVQSLRSADAVLAVLPPQPAPSPVPPWPGDDDWCGAVLNDLNSIIHQHCGSDGSDDAHCDWVNDLANEVVRYFQRPDVLPAPPPVPSWPDGDETADEPDWDPFGYGSVIAPGHPLYAAVFGQRIIEDTLRDACLVAYNVDALSRAILVRLVQNDPPILLCTPDEMKD